MTPSQKLRSIADSTGLDGIANAIREVANEIDAPAVPQGWKLVPVEMTDEMRDAGNEFICNRWLLKSAYAAMLAASPAAPSQPVTLTDDLRQQLDVALGQVRYLLKDQAEKAAIIAALREKEGK